MAMPKRAALNVRMPSVVSNADESCPAKSFGRPKPVLCDEEAAWFSDTTGQPMSERVHAYIEQRFSNLLPSEDIAYLKGNPVMVELMAKHCAQFDATPAEAAAETAPRPTLDEIFANAPAAATAQPMAAPRKQAA